MSCSQIGRVHGHEVCEVLAGWSGAVCTGGQASAVPRFAYAVNQISNGSISAYRINASTGALTRINGVPTGAIACNGTDFLAGTIPYAIAITGGIQ
jgi:hypothetical protein